MYPTFSFSAFGSSKVKRSVSQVCADLTRELEEIQQEQEAEAKRLADEVLELTRKHQEASLESSKAATAIENIKGLFGG
jgi:hypothetical protein